MSGPVRVVVFGATGTSGSAVVRQCLADDRVAEVRAITRRPIGFGHRKLRDIHCHDFAHPESIAHQLTNVDVCFFCLGTSRRRAGSVAAYREITLTYPLVASDILVERSPDHTFVHVSAAGADPTGRSATLRPIAARSRFQLSWLRSFRYCSKSVTWRVEQRAPLSMNSFLFANTLPRQ